MQSDLDPKDSAKSDLCLHRAPPCDQEFIAHRDRDTVWSTAVLEIVVTTSQSDDRSRAVVPEKSGPEVDGGLHNRSNPILNHAILVTGGV